MNKSMNKVTAKVSSFLSNAKTKAGYASLVLANSFNTVCAKAGGLVDTTGDGGAGGSIVEEAIKAVMKVFPWVGAFFIASGVFKLIMAYRGENPEAQTAAAKDIAIGAALCVFGIFIWPPIGAKIFGS